MQFSLVILLLGVGIATVTDLQLNALGSVLSLLAVITTCVAQIVSCLVVTLATDFPSLTLLNLSLKILLRLKAILFVGHCIAALFETLIASSDDKYHTEEVQSLFNTVVVPVLPLPGYDFIHCWPLFGWSFD